MNRVAAFAYGAAIVAAELAIALDALVVGIAAHAIVLLVLVNHAVLADLVRRPSRHEVTLARNLLVALTLVPVLRISSFAVLLPDARPLYRYALAGAPLLLGALAAARAAFGLRGLRRLLSWSRRHQLPIAASGVPLGLAGYAIGRPDGLAVASGWADVVLASVVVAVFVGLAEELAFRGVLQHALTEFLGGSGWLMSSALYASVYLAAGSPSYVAFAAVVGVAFGWLVTRTASIAGVAIAHSLLAVGMLVAWPRLLG